MKKQNLSDELVQKTVEVLDEVENAVLDIQTGVKAGGRSPSSCGDAGMCPQPPYGVGTD